jgi:hypothetical protein
MTFSKTFSMYILVVYTILQFFNLPSEVNAIAPIHSQASIVLSSAVFGSDGLTVDVSLSGDTNKGDQVLSFACDSLFTFAGNTEASCFWTSAATFRMTLSASANELVGVQSMVTLKANSIRPTSDLTSYVPVSSITIAKSPNPVKPAVFISAPYKVGTCDAPAIDVTTSTGSCGRDWKSAVLLIESVPLSVTLGDHSIFPPLVIPIGMLSAGYDYSFTYTLCNFMDVCSTALHVMHATDVKTPIVVIQGQATRAVFTQNSLLLTADGYTANCDGTKSSSDVTYSWKVFANDVLDSSIVSISTDSKKFKVAPFELIPLTAYKS